MKDEYTAEYQEEQREHEREKIRALEAQVDELEAETGNLRHHITHQSGVVAHLRSERDEALAKLSSLNGAEDALRDAKFYKEMYEREQKKTEMLTELNAAHERLISEWIRKA